MFKHYEIESGRKLARVGQGTSTSKNGPERSPVVWAGRAKRGQWGRFVYERGVSRRK